MSHRRRRRGLVGAAIATVVVASGGIVAVQTLSSDADTAITSDSPATASPSTTSGTGEEHDSVESVTAVFPPPLAGASTCLKGSRTAAGDLYLLCTIEPGSTLGQGVSNRDLVVFTTWVNRPETEKTLAGWRDDDRPELLVENTARTIGARIEEHPVSVSTEYVDTDTGLYVNVDGLLDAAAAEAFLQRAGLL